MTWSGPNAPNPFEESNPFHDSEPESTAHAPAQAAPADQVGPALRLPEQPPFMAPTVPDAEVYSLAYTGSVDALKQQDATLGNLRTRASAMFATAALATSFAAGLGLFSTNPAQ